MVCFMRVGTTCCSHSCYLGDSIFILFYYSTMTKRATVITDHLNSKFFTDKRIDGLANLTEDAIVVLNGLKNAGDAILSTRDEISACRKALMCAIDAQDRDAVEALTKQLNAFIDSINNSDYFSSTVAYGRAVRAKVMGTDEVATLAAVDIADDAKPSKKSK